MLGIQFRETQLRRSTLKVAPTLFALPLVCNPHAMACPKVLVLQEVRLMSASLSIAFVRNVISSFVA